MSIFDIKTKSLLFHVSETGPFGSVAMRDFDIDDHDYKNLAILLSPNWVNKAIKIFEISDPIATIQ